MGWVKGFATSPNDLLDKIRIFLLGEGYTTDMWQVSGTGYRLHMHRNGLYLGLHSYNGSAAPWGVSNGFSGNGIALSVNLGFNSGLDFKSQAGVPFMSLYWGNGNVGTCMGSLPSGPYISHQFFHDGNGNVLIMLEQAPNSWRHMCWGETIDKTGAGSWNGGQYYGSYCPGFQANGGFGGTTDVDDLPPMEMSPGGQGSTSFLRADVDTFQGKFLFSSTAEESSVDPTGNFKGFTTGYMNSDAAGGGSNESSNWKSCPKFGEVMRESLFNIQDSRAILLPIMFFAHRDAGGSSFLGTLPSIYLTAAKWNGVDYGQDIIIGSETYRLFNGFVVKVVS